MLVRDSPAKTKIFQKKFLFLFWGKQGWDMTATNIKTKRYAFKPCYSKILHVGVWNKFRFLSKFCFDIWTCSQKILSLMKYCSKLLETFKKSNKATKFAVAVVESMCQITAAKVVIIFVTKCAYIYHTNDMTATKLLFTTVFFHERNWEKYQKNKVSLVCRFRPRFQPSFYFRTFFCFFD